MARPIKNDECDLCKKEPPNQQEYILICRFKKTRTINPSPTKKQGWTLKDKKKWYPDGWRGQLETTSVILQNENWQHQVLHADIEETANNKLACCHPTKGIPHIDIQARMAKQLTTN
jgi:hypothetical protein